MNSQDFCRAVCHAAEGFDADLVAPMSEADVLINLNNLVANTLSRRFGTPKALLHERVRVCLARLNHEPLIDLGQILAIIDTAQKRIVGDNDNTDKNDDGTDGDVGSTSKDLYSLFSGLANLLVCVVLYAPNYGVYARSRAVIARFLCARFIDDEADDPVLVQREELIMAAVFGTHEDDNSQCHQFGYAQYERIRDFADAYARGAFDAMLTPSTTNGTVNDSFGVFSIDQLQNYAHLLCQQSEGQRMLLEQDYGRVAGIITWPLRIAEHSQSALRALIERAAPGAVLRSTAQSDAVIDAMLQNYSAFSDDSAAVGSSVENDGDIALRALALLFRDPSRLLGAEDAQEQAFFMAKTKHSLPLLCVWKRVGLNGPLMEQSYDSLVSQKRDSSGVDVCVVHHLFAIVEDASHADGIAFELLAGPLRGLRMPASLAALVSAHGGLSQVEKDQWHSGTWRLIDSIQFVSSVDPVADWCPFVRLLHHRPYVLRGADELPHLQINVERLFVKGDDVGHVDNFSSEFLASTMSQCAQDDLPIGRRLHTAMNTCGSQQQHSVVENSKTSSSKIRRIDLDGAKKIQWLKAAMQDD